MEKGEKVLLILTILVLVLNIFWFFSCNSLENTITSFFILKDFIFHIATSIANVFIIIIPPELRITIYSPENTTYNFSIGDIYTIDLNVSASFNTSNWWYTLEDLKHSIIVHSNVSFTPNSTFDAVRWSNKIIVYADDSFGNLAANSTVFFVSVPNSAPILSGVPSNIYVCEAGSLSYYFNISDADEQDVYIDISPKNPFYVSPIAFHPLPFQTNFSSEIFSGTLTKSHVGLHQETVSVNDAQYIDTKKVNITVIEINNAPSVDEIGVQTIWTKGNNSTFLKQIQVTDTEDGNSSSGNLTFNITFPNSNRLFNISNFGWMNFSSNGSDIRVYNITVCVKDKGISDIHQNISLCGQNGSAITSCKNFSLTITGTNRYPYISSYYPTILNFSANGNDNLYFNISKYDPDGTIPDAYWYVDNVLKGYYSGSSVDTFNYVFGCDVSGTHSVKVAITDGLLNDSIQWNVDVFLSPCPAPSADGGGGGAGIISCFEEWVGDEWNTCQNAKASFDSGILSSEDFRIINQECSEKAYDERYCGFQIRDSHDLNSCNNNNYRVPKPRDIKVCYYTEEPSCYDKITNCHDDSCELLVDCGGPCPPCATCSDKIKNQGEEDIDCGGPCPQKCELEKPLAKIFNLWWLLLIIIIAILFYVLFKKASEVMKIAKTIKES